MTNEWQPIETAPKDGTCVLLWWEYWCDRAVTGKFNKRGFWDSTVALSDGNDPTHWMPLPEPPK